jgi:hypothetical protein
MVEPSKNDQQNRRLPNRPNQVSFAGVGASNTPYAVGLHCDHAFFGQHLPKFLPDSF